MKYVHFAAVHPGDVGIERRTKCELSLEAVDRKVIYVSLWSVHIYASLAIGIQADIQSMDCHRKDR